MKDILRILEEDCRTGVEDIACMTGKSVEEVRAAIEDFEKKGIIRAYRAVIDWALAGDERVVAFIDVRVTPERGVGFDDVAERIYHFPEVHAVHLVSGAHDLRVTAAGKSLKEVAFFVAEKLATIDRVQSTTTHFLLKTYKTDGVVFESPEPDHRLPVAP